MTLDHTQRADVQPTSRRAVRPHPVRGAARARRQPGQSAQLLPIALTLPMADYAVEEVEELELPPQIQAVTMLGHPCHYRARPSDLYGAGDWEFCVLDDGFLVQVSNLIHCVPSYMSVTAPDMLRVRVATAGEGEYVTPHGEAFTFDGPSAGIIIEPAGQPPAQAVFTGPNRAVHVYIHRGALERLYEGGAQELPPAVQAFLVGELDRTAVRSLPLSPALLRCLEDLQACVLEGHSRRLFIRSKAVEILCHAFEALGQEDGAGSTTLTARGVMKAQRILADNFVTPPSLGDLAQEVGMSRSGLCAGFRQIVGQSVYDYIQELRMREALGLLAERRTSITEIAYAVGYTYPSSFSVAVQRRFGATPRELRRRGTIPRL